MTESSKEVLREVNVEPHIETSKQEEVQQPNTKLKEKRASKDEKFKEVDLNAYRYSIYYSPIPFPQRLKKEKLGKLIFKIL